LTACERSLIVYYVYLQFIVTADKQRLHYVFSLWLRVLISCISVCMQWL